MFRSSVSVADPFHTAGGRQTVPNRVEVAGWGLTWDSDRWSDMQLPSIPKPGRLDMAPHGGFSAGVGRGAIA